ncbi:MAG: VWA domain-containing protein [Acidobacteriota bacterium]|nr:VWA domain-containing protein [Acidobacteriota bacterium]
MSKIDSHRDPGSDPTSLEQELHEQLSSLKTPAERHSILQLTRDLTRLPLDQSAAVLETSAAIAGVSLRASIEFLRAAPEAAATLEATELRSWGEMGRRLALGDAETAVSFFLAGVNDLRDLDPGLRPLLFQVCLRQITLSSTVAVATLHSAPALAKIVDDPEILRSVFEIAAEISRRSAKHSADFLRATPKVTESLKRFKQTPAVQQSALSLAAEFAQRAGGIAADAWSTLPEAIATLDPATAILLLKQTSRFLERGGGVALQVLVSGSEILCLLPEVFEEWIELLLLVAEHGNASLVAFVRSSPRFVRSISGQLANAQSVDTSRRVMQLTRKIAQIDGEAALACFRASAQALRSVSIEQFEEWVGVGLALNHSDARARRSYFAVETRSSHDALHTGGNGLPLESVQHLLLLYIEGLTGRTIEIAPLAAVPVESRISDGRTIYLPSLVAEFADDELDFRLYKVLAAHAAGQIEFGTYERNTVELRAAHAGLAELYDEQNADALDAFAVADELLASGTGVRGPRRGSPAGVLDPPVIVAKDAPLSHNHAQDAHATLTQDAPSTLDYRQNATLDYRAVLKLFPIAQLARRIFGTLENARIDHRLRQTYRGLVRDLDLIREHLRRGRPRIVDLPAAMVPFELLFQVTLCGGALDDARQFYAQIISELETIAANYLNRPDASVADSLMATSRVYTLFKSITPDDAATETEPEEESADDDTSDVAQKMFHQKRSERISQRQDVRELFNAWNDPNAEGEPDELDGAEAWLNAESPEQNLEEGEVAFNYDEWDRDLTDHRLGWCRVIEKQVKHGDRAFVDGIRERYKGVISSIRHQFQLMKPEDLTRVFNELDGEEFDLNAVVDYVIDKRAARVGGGHQSERLYTKRLRRRRDVAVSFLLDQSSSTARTIGRHPLQPYTHPGRRIIEIEKEGLVLMSEALEAVGDIYSINGFTSEGRRNVKFFVVKDFDEQYSDEVKRRIGGITYQNNTRLGAAIRHAAARLKKQSSRTRLLIVLSDGRPYDHDYGDARYAREDTREALRQAKNAGIIPFCITIDRESEAELRDLYGEIGYTIIDDVLTLPERLPGIYRRLTA